jgi:6-phosphogluconolactonase/glucosamine-6-phosphate isomerase/deaminase
MPLDYESLLLTCKQWVSSQLSETAHQADSPDSNDKRKKKNLKKKIKRKQKKLLTLDAPLIDIQALIRKYDPRLHFNQNVLRNLEERNCNDT